MSEVIEYKNIEKFIRETFNQPEELIECGRPYFWFEKSNNGNTVRALLLHDDYAVNIECVYGFYGYPCDCNTYYVYKDKSLVKIFRELWDKGARKRVVFNMGHITALRKFFDKIFNKRSQIAKYEEEYLLDTLNMASKLVSSAEELQVPDDLSLKNLHDFLSENLTLDEYREHEKVYKKHNEKVWMLSGKYLGFDVIVPRDIKEHHVHGLPFRNCITSYIPRVNQSNKVIYVYKDEKPIYCVLTADFLNNVAQAKKPCNKGLTQKEDRQLAQILSELRGAYYQKEPKGTQIKPAAEVKKKKKGLLSLIGIGGSADV